MKKLLTILSLLISSYSFSQVVVKFPQPNLSNYVTRPELVDSIKTDYVRPPGYWDGDTLKIYTITDTTLAGASDTTVASSLAVKTALTGKLNKTDSTNSTNGYTSLYQNSLKVSKVVADATYATIANLATKTDGSGTANYLPRFSASKTFGNSTIKDSLGIRTNNTVGGVLLDMQFNGVSVFTILTGGNIFATNTFTGGKFIGKGITSQGGMGGAGYSYLSNVSFNPISTGDALGFQNNDQFTDTTGNATYTAFSYIGGITQKSGVSSGITRGLYINPVVNSAVNFRAIELKNIFGRGIYQSGVAPNSFVGKTLFSSDSTKTATASVEVAPTSTSPGGGAFKIDPAIKLITPESGLIENDTTGGNYHLLWTNKAGVRLQLDKQGIDTVNSVTSLIAYNGLSNLVYLTDSLQQGWFYLTATGTVDNGTIFTATGKGGKWNRIYDRSKGVNVDWWGDRTNVAINNAVAAASVNGIINFTPNKTYIQYGRVLATSNQTFNGNNATLQRGIDSIVTLTSVANTTDSFIVVSSLPSYYISKRGYIHLFTDTTDFSSSTLLDISSIKGDTIRFGVPIGGLYNPDGTHTQITQWAIGTKVHFEYSQIEDNAVLDNFSVHNLTFDGNKANNGANHSWRINTTVLLHGNESQATIDHCKFLNIPNENIMGHGFHITDNHAKNLNGSFVHLSANFTAFPPNIPSYIKGNTTDSTNLIPNSVGAHSEGVITYSFTSGYVNITDNRFYNGGDAVFGAVQSGNGIDGGVRNMKIQDNYAENFNGIFYGNLANPTGITNKFGHIFIQGNTFNKCGTTDWSTYQSNINLADTIMIGNNMLVGGTVWIIPVQNSDAQQRFILNNSTTTAQGGNINITGTVKGSNIITITTGTAAPTTTPAKIGDEFLDLTNKKYYKAFGTSSSSDWIIQN